jgi:tetratricopeptide (TPR) repeat protein
LAQDAPAKDQRKRNRIELLLRLATLEFRLGMLEPAFAHADQLAGEADMLASITSNFFGTRQVEALAWHGLIKHHDPSLPLTKVLAQIHQLMRWPVPAEATEEEFTRWLEPAAKYASTLEPKAARGAYLSNLAATYIARDWVAHARTLLEPVAADSAPAALQLADLDAEQKNWQAAADRYLAAYELEPTRLEALMLAGIANGKLDGGKSDGKPDGGERRSLGERQRLQARLIAGPARVRHSLAKNLSQRGHTAEAIEEFRLAAATGFFDTWESNDATRLLGDAVAETDPALAARCWDRSLLGLLTQNDFLEVESYLRVPFMIHKERAKALAAAKDYEGVAAAAGLAFAIAPGDVRLAEELVPVLDAAGQKELADRLFQQTYDKLSAVVAQYPECPLHLNNLAWVSARCRRQLDKALELATRSTKLAPTTPNYLDTLAEIHFQRGDRETAVRLSERAVQMGVRQKVYRDQLTRFQNEKLP